MSKSTLFAVCLLLSSMTQAAPGVYVFAQGGNAKVYSSSLFDPPNLFVGRIGAGYGFNRFLSLESAISL